MIASERQFVIKVFSSYYENAPIDIPGVEKREFGIGNIKKIDARHLSFGSNSEFRRYLCNNTPMFVSHSTAYYDFPAATPIQKKQWKGADLVFDLDIHAEGKYGAYPKLDEVKEEAKRLLNDFILGDFGVSMSDVAAVFSGNRGYHIHVRDRAFLTLGGEERRELVDYVMGQGLNYLDFFAFDDKKRLLGPRPDEGGYRGRLARATLEVLAKNPASLSRKFTNEKDREFFISGINEGNWSKTTLNLKDLQERLGTVAKNLPVSAIDTDAGVTQDLSKLIRVPNTIHGETGLVARAISNLDTFNPWRDATIKSSEMMKVRFLEDTPAIEMEETVGPFKKGEEKDLSRQLGVFFVLKGSATIS